MLRGDSIFMDCINAIIKNGDTLTSPTLGAKYYNGKLTKSDSVRVGKLKLVGSDYTVFFNIKNPETGKYEDPKRKPLILKLQMTVAGLLVDGILFKKDIRTNFPLISDKRNLKNYMDSLKNQYIDSLKNARSK